MAKHLRCSKVLPHTLAGIRPRMNRKWTARDHLGSSQSGADTFRYRGGFSAIGEVAPSSRTAVSILGIVVNDLVRGWRHLFWSWLFTRPFNEVLRNDGSLPLRPALRPAELARVSDRSATTPCWISLFLIPRKAAWSYGRRSAQIEQCHL